MGNAAGNKVLIQRGFEEEWNNGNLDVIPELFTADVICHMVHSPDIHGQDNWKVFITAFRNAFQISILRLRIISGKETG